MKNKLLINKIKNAAELAMAAYGYYDLMTNSDNQLFIEIQNKKNEDFIKKDITLIDIMDNTFADYKVYKPQLSPKFKPDKVGILKGDMTPTQAQRFFSRYDLLIHQPNTESGFSATLFQNKETKEYTLAIRGTEFNLEQIKDLINDYYIGTNNDDLDKVIEQYFDMLIFYEETLKPLLQEKGITKINITGHSLGGYLAQRALIYCDSLYKDKLKFSPSEVYTFNTSLESMSVA